MLFAADLRALNPANPGDPDVRVELITKVLAQHPDVPLVFGSLMHLRDSNGKCMSQRAGGLEFATLQLLGKLLVLRRVTADGEDGTVRCFGRTRRCPPSLPSPPLPPRTSTPVVDNVGSRHVLTHLNLETATEHHNVQFLCVAIVCVHVCAKPNAAVVRRSSRMTTPWSWTWTAAQKPTQSAVA